MSTELALAKPDNSYLTDPEKFNHLYRVAKAFSMSSLMPETLRGKPENCFILAQLAIRLNVDLFMLAQNTYVVHGRPGMEAKLQIGLLNASGRIKGNIAYQFSGEGDEYGCSAVVVDAMTGETIVGPKVDWKMVMAEGWDKPKGSQVSKWKTMPEMMYRYRAASLLIRAHYPEVTLGLLTREELEESIIDVESTLAEPAPPQMTKAEAIAQQVRVVEKPQEAVVEAVEATPGPEVVEKPRTRKAKPAEAALSDFEEVVAWVTEQTKRIGQCHTSLELPAVVEALQADAMMARCSQQQCDHLAACVAEAEARLG